MSSLLHFFAAGGWVMYPLLALSLLAVGVIIERLLSYRTIANDSPGLLNEILSDCEQGEFDQAITTCQKRPGPVAACLGTVLMHRDQPVEDIERNVQEVGEEFFLKLERFLPILDTTTTISPLLGLLGTLFGMIGTFQAIAASKSQGSRDSILSGVGEALYATATGLTIAVICFVAYNYFSSRQKAVTSETEQSATKLINALRSKRVIDYQMRERA
jgi:biopolymer transport protein ExbB